MRYSISRETNNRPSKKLTALALSGVVGLFCASKAHTEETLFDLSIEQLMETKVSTVASLFEESELDTASSVSVLKSSNWEKNNSRRLSEALEAVPSVATYPTWGGADAIAIRGYSTELSVRGIANSLEGVPLNSFTYATSLYDKPMINLQHLDRIEMIRGPGSTLYGSDAFHGVMSQHLKSSNTSELRLSGSTAAPEHQNFALFASQPFGNTYVNTGLAYDKQGGQDLEYSYTSPSDGLSYQSERDYEYEDISAFVTLKSGDIKSGQFKLSTYFNDYSSSEFPGTGTQFFTRLPLVFDLDSSSITMDKEHSGQESKFWMAGLNYALQLSENYTLDTQLYHWESEQEWQFDNSRYPASLTTRVDLPSPGGGTLPAGTAFSCRTASNSNTTINPLYCAHELKQGNKEQRSGAQATIKALAPQIRTQWAVGIGRDYLKVKDSEQSRIALNGDVLAQDENPYKGESRDITFALLQAKTTLPNDKIHFVYGVRADNYSDLDTVYSPRLGTIFKVSETYTTKLLYGEAFRAPNAIERSGSVQGVEANKDIKPEEISTLEWVNILLGRDYSIELTLYQSEWKDGIVLKPSTSTLNRYVNTGENESYGAELSGEKQWGALALSGAGSYSQSKNKEENLDYIAFPEWMFTLQGSYQFQSTGIELVLKERIMLDYYEGDYIGTSKANKADNYYRTDLSLIKRYKLKAPEQQLEVFLNIKNLFDRDNTIASLYNAEGGLVDYGLSTSIGARISW
jgi:outer membrane cobalamin receptor